MKKILTLCIVQQGNNVLLGMKKRGFGAGRWNGFGGKLKEGETLESAASREVKEESGVEILQMQKVGILDFEFSGNPEILEVHVFRIGEFSGQPVETEEMKPHWFHTNEIPFKDMWPDDIYWMPLFLSGKKFKGKFLFGNADVILKQELAEVMEI